MGSLLVEILPDPQPQERALGGRNSREVHAGRESPAQRLPRERVAVGATMQRSAGLIMGPSRAQQLKIRAWPRGGPH